MNAALSQPPAPSTPWSSVVAGDADALESLFAEWMPTTLQWCRRLGGPRVDPDQAAQEVFLVVLRRVHTVHSREVFPTWLMSVTRRVLAQLRRRAFPTRWAADHDLERAAGSTSDGELEQRELGRRVRQIIATLPPELAQVLVLCDIEERPDPEAAAILEIPVGTAKSRLRRARADFAARAKAMGLAGSEDR